MPWTNDKPIISDLNSEADRPGADAAANRLLTINYNASIHFGRESLYLRWLKIFLIMRHFGGDQQFLAVHSSNANYNHIDRKITSSSTILN